MAATLNLGTNGNWAVKDGSLLGYNKENNNFKPLPFDFTRASSATRVNQQGLIETVASGVPRIDYTDANGALLLEPQRTNLITYSEDFTTGWGNLISGSGINPVVTSNQGTSPDGSLNADKVVFDLNGGTSSSDYSLLDYSLSGFSNPHTLDTSIYLKSSDGNDYQVAIYNRGTSVQIITVTSQWQRFSVNGTRSNTTNNFRIGLFGDNSSNTASLLLFGTQAEQGSYATSYIPTSGQSGGVTRVADACNNGGNDQVINSTEGVLYANIKGENDGTFNYISLSDGGTTNYAGILYTDTDNEITYRYYVGGSGVQIIINSINVTNFNKIAIKWKANDFAIWINGVEQGTATSGSLNPSGTFNQLSFARGGSNNTPFYGNCKELKVYNTALTDAELIALTS